MALGNNLKKRKPNSDSLSDEGSVEMSNEVAIEDSIPEVISDEVDELVQSELICVFRSGGEEYGIPIDYVKEVVKISSIAPVPQMPDYIRGMVNVRGNIYAVLDLAMLFGIIEHSDKDFKYLIVLSDEERKVAIRVPMVPDTLQVSLDMIETLSSTMLKSINKQEFLKGIIKKDKRMIIVLNILDMISSDSFVQ